MTLSPESASLQLAADQKIIDEFHLLWYERRQRQTWRATSFLEVPMQQAPTDLWVYQEIVCAAQPKTIVEVGVKKGGTTLWFAHLLDMLGRGRVVGIDLHLDPHKTVRRHPRITLLEGDSVAAETFEQVKRIADGSAMVLLDSDHHCHHVLAELRLYSTLIAVGGYLIVNDTNINGHPAIPDWGKGPFEAVQEFLAVTNTFEIDASREKHMLTQSPSGFLRRIR
jgi:cephalosporin hydroxylase